MAGSIFVRPKAAPISSSGAPYAGAKYYFYATGTSTLQSVYTDSALTTPHANPVVADGTGTFAPIWLDPTKTYRAKLTTAAGVLLEDVDPVDTKAPSAANVTFLQSGTGAVTRYAQDKMREVVSVKDFGAVGDGVTDDTAAIQAAIASLPANQGGTIFFKAGDYKITSTITLPSNVNFIGQGNSRYYGTTLICSPANTINGLQFTDRNCVRDMSIEAAAIGIYVYQADHNYIDNVSVNYCTTGLALYMSIWNTFVHVDCFTNTTGLLINGDNANNYQSNNNTFMGCKFRYSTGNGAQLNRGQNNAFFGCNFERSSGIGLLIDSADSNFIPSWQVSSHSGNHLFSNCWFEANTQEAIYVKEDVDSTFQNAYVLNSSTQTYGVIRVERARNTRFVSGTMRENAATKRPLYIANTASYTEVGIDYYGYGSASGGGGVNTTFTRPVSAPIVPTAVATLTNSLFNTAGGGGADVFANWSEFNNNGTTGGTITRDTSDLIRPSSVSGGSCKIQMVASPSAACGINQAASIACTGQTIYACIEWKNDTALTNINAPLSFNVYDATNALYYNFATGAWQAGSVTYVLPLTAIPATISVPVVLPGSGTNSIRMLISNAVTGSDASSATHHIYYADFQTRPQHNPA